MSPQHVFFLLHARTDKLKRLFFQEEKDFGLFLFAFIQSALNVRDRVVIELI